MSKKPKVNVLPIEQGATPDPQNANKHTARGGALLENSLQRRGAFRSIASAGKGVETPVVYAGNYTLEKAIDAGFTEVVNVHVTGNQIVNVVRDDIEPGTAAAIALGLEDNEIGKQSYNPDIDILAAVMADPAMQALKDEDKILAGIVEGMTPYKVDYEKEWEGMPEFNYGEAKAFRSMGVHFQKKMDYDDFIELIKNKIEQPITEKTKSIWYPRKPESQEGLVFENES